jgi:hypothetical protein
MCVSRDYSHAAATTRAIEESKTIMLKLIDNARLPNASSGGYARALSRCSQQPDGKTTALLFIMPFNKTQPWQRGR